MGSTDSRIAYRTLRRERVNLRISGKLMCRWGVSSVSIYIGGVVEFHSAHDKVYIARFRTIRRQKRGSGVSVSRPNLLIRRSGSFSFSKC